MAASGDDTTTFVESDGLSMSERPKTPRLEVGTEVGRYRVLGLLGSGGMGVVYRAYDPELDRPLALKVLRADLFAAPEGSEDRLRLLREAQALARLAHPNVVAVFDAGTFAGGVFIAMELVEGSTLKEWVDLKRRSWRQVLEVYLQAGRGLAAAHRAGLVHRDFKPGNAIVDPEGRARVLDFGLARAPVLANSRQGTEVSQDRRVLELELTRSGARLGTPAYMAPEQRANGSVDARSDQYSFCCALYEALYGYRPSSAAPLTSRDDDQGSSSQPVDSAPTGPEGTGSGRVPRWLKRQVERGLHPDPAHRHPSLDALLGRLDPGRRTRRWRAVLVAATLCAVLAWGWWQSAARQSRLCAGAEDHLAGIWDGDRRRQMATAFAGSRTPFAATSLVATQSLLDAYADRWVDIHVETCEATRLRGEQSPAMLDARMICLDDRLRELDAVIDQLTTADDQIIERAVEAAADLRSPRLCSDLERLAVLVPLPTDQAIRSHTADSRRMIAAARALRAAGKLERGLQAARQADAQAAQIDYPPLAAEARYQLADLLHQNDRYEDSEAALIETLALAEHGRHDRVRAEAMIDLVWVTGLRLRRLAEGQRWLQLAEGGVARLDVAPDLNNRWFHAAAKLALETDDFEVAASAARAAVAGGESLHGTDDPLIGRYLSTLVLVELRRGRYQQALAPAERLLALRRAGLGVGHPLVGAAEQALGTVLRRVGRLRDAEFHLRAALDVVLTGFGADSDAAAIARSQLAQVLIDRGEHREALEHFRLAYEIRRSLYGPDHIKLTGSLSGMGRARKHLEEFEAAETNLQQVLELTRSAGGTRSAQAHAQINLGDLKLAAGSPRLAKEHFLAARDLATSSLGTDHPLMASIALGLGEAEFALGRPDTARQSLEEALSRFEDGRDPVLLARCRFALARALQGQGSSPDRARRLALDAARGYAEIGRAGQNVHEEIIDWLDTIDIIRESS